MNLQTYSDCVDFNLHYNGGKYFTTDRNCQLFFVLRCYWKISGQEQIHEPTTYSDHSKLLGLTVLFPPKRYSSSPCNKTKNLFAIRFEGHASLVFDQFSEDVILQWISFADRRDPLSWPVHNRVGCWNSKRPSSPPTLSYVSCTRRLYSTLSLSEIKKAPQCPRFDDISVKIQLMPY